MGRSKSAWVGKAPCKEHAGVRDGGKASEGRRVHGNRGRPEAFLGGRPEEAGELMESVGGDPQGKQKVGAQAGIQLRHWDSFPFHLIALALVNPADGLPAGTCVSAGTGSARAGQLSRLLLSSQHRRPESRNPG